MLREYHSFESLRASVSAELRLQLQGCDIMASDKSAANSSVLAEQQHHSLLCSNSIQI